MTKKRKVTFEERLNQLEVALRALKHANNHYLESGDVAYLLDLMARLRALACSGGPNMTPLLLQLMDEAKVEIYLYSWSDRVTAYSEKSVYSIIIGKTWQVYQYADYIKYSFVDWLNEPFYFSEIGRKHYSRNEVLRRISNTQGGSHYELKVPFLVDKLASVKINNKRLEETMIEHVLRDVAMATYWAGSRFLLLLQQKENRVPDIEELMRELDNEFDMLEKNKPRGAILLGNERYKIICTVEVSCLHDTSGRHWFS